MLAPVVREALLDAWAVVMPVECAGCASPDRALCTECRIRLTPEPTWHRLPDGTPVVSALDYSGAVRQVILALKEKGRTDVAGALAVPLRSAIDAAIEFAGQPSPELALVPTSRSSFRRRGYDPVALLVRKAGLTHHAVLRHARSTAQQKTLDLESRSSNLAGSLHARRPLDGRCFILIDDVMTSGATLGEAARAIRESGGEVMGGVTVAHTARLDPIHSSFRDQLVTSTEWRSTVGKRGAHNAQVPRAARRKGTGRTPWKFPSTDAM
jgi:predicted amidophosphoribosyltransferase